MRNLGDARASADVPQPIAPVVASPPAGRRRRPSGEPPPLPRHIAPSTPWYVAALLAVAFLEVALAVRPSREALTRVDDAALQAFARLRTDWLVTLMRSVDHLGLPIVVSVLGWATIAVLLLARHLRRLIVFLAVVLSAVLAVSSLAFWQQRMRPAGIRIVGDWTGYSHPSAPVATLAAVGIGALYATLPRGRWRNDGKRVVGAVVGTLCAARLLLGVDHPTDLLAAVGIGWALPIVAFRLLTPDDVFPVSYRRTQRAHLDVGGEHGAAIVRALDQQLGIHVLSAEPFGLAGSAGSTPLRLRTQAADGREATLFAKLYATNHLRADRSYKMSRMVLYGRLEDEKPFSTVRRLVEYEDHMLRLLRDAGLPTPQPYGLVEITPEREYMIVMEFYDGAREAATGPLTEREIDDALAIVRRLWQVGVAHRDIKPSNLLVRDGQVMLIDVAFATVRPTPWRQAVDLANMMLTLALVSTAEVVYERAVRVFAPDDLAEAFAASRSVTIPTQLRARLRADGRDLVTQFRDLAPARPVVPIQLWTMPRVGVTAGVLLAVALAAIVVYLYAGLVGFL
jgi:tRNA A-37 threonylcarbamoyl transferase component Bud32/membrane-associated phospholipid phosphatase